jgi:ABC-type multidrug transport system fused ATPase/permease subunit
VTALVGPSGAGKTTITDLLLRLYEPTAGEILIDEQPLSTLDPAAVRQAVSVVSADGAVFRGTLADNIRYKRPDANDAEVAAAVHDAGLARAVARLPQGLETPIGEGGIGLSVGERQRLQIARAFVSRPRILVLDEATANLDYATELDVKAALDAMRRGRTTLVIAHRYSMVRDADHVLVLDGGYIVEAGTPADLAAAGGWFARFAAAAADVGRDADRVDRGL